MIPKCSSIRTYIVQYVHSDICIIFFERQYKRITDNLIKIGATERQSFVINDYRQNHVKNANTGKFRTNLASPVMPRTVNQYHSRLSEGFIQLSGRNGD